jgi:hypothetical protein
MSGMKKPNFGSIPMLMSQTRAPAVGDPEATSNCVCAVDRLYMKISITTTRYLFVKKLKLG